MTSLNSRIQCVTCTKTPPRQATPGYVTCNRCADLIRECLDDIVQLYATVTKVSALLPVVAPGARRGPGFASRSPANDQAIVLTDPRTTWTEETPVHNPLTVVESWARMVREDVGEKPPDGPATITGEVALLIRRLDWITRQGWVDEMWKELKEARANLRDFNGQHKPLPIGKCPTLVEDGTCNTPLFGPPDGEDIRCRGCSRVWTRREWLHLGQTLTSRTEPGGSAA